VVDNAESWLIFTDLVFIDPIGTGFSRSLPQDKDIQDKSGEKANPSQVDKPKETEFGSRAGLESVGEFIQRFLSRQKRWLSPIAGELCGFRVARLARKLQQEFGVGLSGAILISPALEFSLLAGDYNLTSWRSAPLFAAAAAHHGRAQWAGNRGLQAHTAA